MLMLSLPSLSRRFSLALAALGLADAPAMRSGPLDDNERARREDEMARRRVAEASQAADEAEPGI